LPLIYLNTVGYSQLPDPRITLTENNASLKQALADVSRLTGYGYFYTEDLFKDTKPVTFTVENTRLSKVLDLCFANQPLTYKIKKQGIFILPKERSRLIQGLVINEEKQPIPGATIMVTGVGSASDQQKGAAITNDSGYFSMHIGLPDSTLMVSCVGYESRTIHINNEAPVIQLKTRPGELGNAVVLSNGYQDIPNERATGSFSSLNRALIERKVSTFILDRMEGVTPSTLFNKNITPGSNQSLITIRGRSTIQGNPNPLIVIDNFPYSGEMNNINPDDIESISILKDAAAASVWGTLAGNGVIVMKTRHGRYNQPTRLSFNTNLTLGLKPDQFYLPRISSGDYIDVEDSLFRRHYYDDAAISPRHAALSPVVEILFQRQKGMIGSSTAQMMIDSLRKQDLRSDNDKYLYRKTWNQHYFLSLSGGSDRDNYYLSAGYDGAPSNLVRNGYQRGTFDFTNNYRAIPGKLELNCGIYFTASNLQLNSGNIGGHYPYDRFTDAHGNPIPVTYSLRKSYVDSAGGGKLLDWHYVPLDELRFADNSIGLTDYKINFGLRYHVFRDLDARTLYQYEQGLSTQQNFHSLKTYYTRDLINEFTQVDTAGNLTHPVPVGGIMDKTVLNYHAHNIRLQLNYSHSWHTDHSIDLLAGWELRAIEGSQANYRLYGFDKDRHSGIPVNYTGFYPQYSNPADIFSIPYLDHESESSDNYLSYYINGSYAYKRRYIFSASARKDESNIFGVNANRKGVPLWSIGGAWDISKEPFYRVDWLPELKMRITDGYNGNVYKVVSGFTTAATQTDIIFGFTNTYGLPSADITNPPNPDLRWEKVNMLNMGLDFGTKGGRVAGSLEYYIKHGADLIGPIPLDPASGNTQYTGNAANMVDHGIDLTLRINHSFGPFQWNNVFLFSLVRDKVTAYQAKLSSISPYLNEGGLNPVPGNPVYSIYGLRWQGLDPQTGDPQGWLNGHVSKDYGAMLSSQDLKDLVYKGPVNPPIFGSWRNTFNWRQWGLSFNIIYKFGYVFRRTSLNYAILFGGNGYGNADYRLRWQVPGDEQHTNVPSMIFPDNSSRDAFYGVSTALIEKGDHIRLQDFQLYYDLRKQQNRKTPFPLIRLYGYMNNVGIIWRANHKGIDPDYLYAAPAPRTIALGARVEF